MNNRHKYFRNLRYKQSLEARYNLYGGHHTGLFFTSKELDPRAVRESTNFYLRFPNLDPATWEKATGREYYISWHRPEVPYSIREYFYGSTCKKLMKRQTARRNRRVQIDPEDRAISSKSYYKKLEDRWDYY